MSTRSAPKILLIKDEYSFRFSIFLIIGLCNSWFDIFSFLTEPPEVLCRKIFKPLKQAHVDIHRILDFLAILNALSRNTLSEAVPPGKPLKSS